MCLPALCIFFFFFNDTATTEIYTLSLHDALPILRLLVVGTVCGTLVSPRSATAQAQAPKALVITARSEEHTSELQSPCNLVCRLLLEKKKKDRRYVPLCTKPTDPSTCSTDIAYC